MLDPVVAEDGITYERMAIEQWLQRSQTSPLTNNPLSSRQLHPNNSLRQIVSIFKACLPASSQGR